jgi:hypothetical protein
MPSRPIASNIPDDLFSIPLSSSSYSDHQDSFNPFEEKAKVQAAPVFEPIKEVKKSPDFGLFDLDLNKPSPAEAKKYQEMNKPVSIGSDVPNVPMHVLQGQNTGGNQGMMTGMPMMPGMMPGMMVNPMMMYNPFMTGMMPNPWMQNPK